MPGGRGGALTLVQQLLGVGGLFALRLKEGVDAAPDQVLPPGPAGGPQGAGFYGDDLSWSQQERRLDSISKIKDVMSQEVLRLTSCLIHLWGPAWWQKTQAERAARGRRCRSGSSAALQTDVE